MLKSVAIALSCGRVSAKFMTKDLYYKAMFQKYKEKIEHFYEFRIILLEEVKAIFVATVHDGFID